MEVTRENFFDVLPFIEESINSCDFMALDLEMTGLSSGKMERQKRWDSAQQRYTKVRDGASVICPTQFGLCTFKYSAESKQYEARPFNIYIYPREFKWLERYFTFQVSSLTFLREHDFDFNKWIDQGVSWLSLDQHEWMASKLLTAFDENSAKIIEGSESTVTPTVADQAWLDDVCKRIDNWESMLLAEDEANQVQGPPSFIVDKTIARTGYQRLLLYQELPKRFSHLTVTSDKDESGDRIVKISKMTTAEFEADRLRRRALLEQEIREAFGFGHIFEAMSKAKKPVLGHNMFMDLGLCFHHFLAPLPESASEFCERLHAMFPQIMDTKTIASKHPDLDGKTFLTTALGDVVDILLERMPRAEDIPAVSLAPQFARYKLPTKDSVILKKSGAALPQATSTEAPTDSAYHEAGFDALLTGFLFLILSAFYCTGVLPSDPVVEPGSQPISTPTEIKPRRPIVHPLLPTGEHEVGLMNSLNLMQIPGTFNLDREHSMPDRRNLYVLSGLTREDKNTHITAVFEAVGEHRITWVDTQSCVLEFTGAYTQARDAKVMRALPRKGKGSAWRLQHIAELDTSRGLAKSSASASKNLQPPPVVYITGLLVAGVAGYAAARLFSRK